MCTFGPSTVARSASTACQSGSASFRVSRMPSGGRTFTQSARRMSRTNAPSGIRTLRIANVAMVASQTTPAAAAIRSPSTTTT